MSRLMSAIALLLSSFPLLAAVRDEAPSGPVDTVGMVPIVIFIALFVGSIVAFLVWYLMADDKPSDKDNERK